MRTFNSRPVAVDLFAGVGGMSLGFEQAGFDIVASVEYDPVHAAVHKFNFPATEVICADINNVGASDVIAAARIGFENHGRAAADWDEQVDVIFGGPPCQGFSTIGKRLVDDDRNRLVFHFLELIADIRPRYFVMENVPGMAAGAHSGILNELIDEVERINFKIVKPWRILNAADFGVPQDRRRLIILGARDDEEIPRYPSPTSAWKKESRGEQITGLPGLPKGPTVLDAIGDLPDLDRFDDLRKTDETHLSAGELKRMTKKMSQYARRLGGIEPDPGDFSHPRIWNNQILTSSLQTTHTAISIQRFARTAVGETEPVSRFLRLDPDGLCNTLRSGTGSERGAYTSPRPIHPIMPRVLSVREAARLHSYPDWFRFHPTKWHGFRQIGNSVPPLMARAIANCVLTAMRYRPVRPRNPIALGPPQLLLLDRLKAAKHFHADQTYIPKSRQREAELAPT